MPDGNIKWKPYETADDTGSEIIAEYRHIGFSFFFSPYKSEEDLSQCEKASLELKMSSPCLLSSYCEQHSI